MNLTSESQHIILSKLTEYARKNNITLWVFGSYSRGTAKNTSDVDLLLDSNNITFPKLLDISYELKVITGVEIDLVATSFSDDSTIKLIKESGRVLWEV